MDRDDEEPPKPSGGRPLLTLKRGKKVYAPVEPRSKPSRPPNKGHGRPSFSHQKAKTPHKPEQKRHRPNRPHQDQKGGHDKRQHKVHPNKHPTKQLLPKPERKASPASVPSKPGVKAREVVAASRRLDSWLQSQLWVWRDSMPLKVGVHLDLMAFVERHPAKPEAWSHHAIRLALFWHSKQRPYLLNLLGQPYRYALDGSACGVVTSQEREAALAKLKTVIKLELEYERRKGRREGRARLLPRNGD